MASDVLSALDLDKESLNEKFILIKEFAGAEATFLVNCLISKQMKGKNAVVLIAIRNPYIHYHNIGLNLGYNLNNLKTQFQCIDCFDIVTNTDPTNTSVDLVSDKKSLDTLFDAVKKELDIMTEKYTSVCLIVDGLLDFTELGFSIQDINLFVQYCRSYAMKNRSVSIALRTHVIPEDDESCVLAGLMSHMSDIICEVSALKTGRSSDISGTLRINRPLGDLSKVSNNLVKLNLYHYKIFERGIKLFAPGSR